MLVLSRYRSYNHSLRASPCADSASADDPNEISFSKGEILDIVDKQGKWWQAKKADGTIGSAYSVSQATDPMADLRPRH